MDNLETESECLRESSESYSLTLEGSSVITPSNEDLSPLTEDGELNDETNKELPRLIIQEQLEETAPTNDSTDPQREYQEEKEQKEGSVGDEVEEMETGNEVENQEEKGQMGYLILNNSERPDTVNLSSDVTPLLVLAYNSDKGMYEANVVLGRTTSGPSDGKISEAVDVGQQEKQNEEENRTDVVEDCEMNSVSEENVAEGKKGSGQLLYLCGIDQCDVVCSSLEDINDHQNTHTEQERNIISTHRGHQQTNSPGIERNLTCPYRGCARKFAWPAHLKYHLLTHSGKRLFTCQAEGCGASFYTIQRLTVHRRVHTGEKPFECPEKNCGKAFTTQGNLKNHLRIHSGERPFSCEVPGCGKRFAEHSSLRKHTLVHSGKKPYECEICGKRFSQSGSKNVHVTRHRTTGAVTEAMEMKAGQKNGETMVVKLQGDNLVVLQQGQDEALKYKGLTRTESVVFTNASTDHVVTITTQPAGRDLEGLNQENLLKIEEHVKADAVTSLATPTTGANVVVLSQPEEMVAMAPGYHHDPGQSGDELSYTGHHLLNVDMT